MKKFFIILSVVTLAVALFVGEARTANLKGKFGAGLEISSFYYDYSYDYYWRGIGFNDMELMYGLTNNLSLIVGGGIYGELRLEIGLQGYVEPTKAVSPYFKVSFDCRNYDSYYSEKIYPLKMGAGVEYFWTEHLGLAIHTSFLTIYFSGFAGNDAQIITIPGIYFWIRK